MDNTNRGKEKEAEQNINTAQKTQEDHTKGDNMHILDGHTQIDSRIPEKRSNMEKGYRTHKYVAEPNS